MMMAGRNISASRLAMSSSRVMGTCAIGGQAVGIAASMCIKYGCEPRGVLDHIDELKEELLKEDCYITNTCNNDENDIARTANVTSSSALDGFLAENVVNGISRGDKNIWISGGISEKGEVVSLALKRDCEISEVRLTFDANFSYPIKLTMSKVRQSEQRIGVPPELIKDYTVTLWKDNKKVAEKAVKDNVQRLNVIDFEPTLCDKVTVTVYTTNGAENARIFEIRIY